MKKRVIFLGKKDDRHCEAALRFVRSNFDVAAVCLGQWGDTAPFEDLRPFDGDIIVSYLSRWVVPGWMLSRATMAINFHPASPEYPGIGCINFALYEGASEYGATCHFMAPKVDTGPIIQTKRFPIFPSDDVASLLERTYDFQLILFYEVMQKILADEALLASGEEWGRKPLTRREFDALTSLTPDMDEREILRRVRSCSFGNWRPKMRIGGVVLQPI